MVVVLFDEMVMAFATHYLSANEYHFITAN